MRLLPPASATARLDDRVGKGSLAPESSKRDRYRELVAYQLYPH